MRLWLDDNRPAPEGWNWAKSVREAQFRVALTINIAQDTFEECSLDHDLAQGERNDGIRFVDWMIETGYWPKSRPVVHSMNPVGRRRMEQAIERYFPGEEAHDRNDSSV